MYNERVGRCYANVWIKTNTVLSDLQFQKIHNKPVIANNEFIPPKSATHPPYGGLDSRDP